MPISDQPGTEDQLYQQFLAWKAGQGFGGGFANPWAQAGEGGTGVGSSGDSGGSSASIARGSEQSGGGAGSIMDEFTKWAQGQGQAQGQAQGPGAAMQIPSGFNWDMGAGGGATAPGQSMGALQDTLGLGAQQVGSMMGYGAAPNWTSGQSLGTVGGGALQAGGLLNTALGGSPAASFGLGLGGDLASLGGSLSGLGAALAPGAGTGLGTAGLAGLAGGGVGAAGAAGAGAGMGAQAAGSMGAGLALAPLAVTMIYKAIMDYVGGVNAADEAKFNATQQRRIMGAYEPGDVRSLMAGIQNKNEDPAFLTELGRSMEASNYTKSRMLNQTGYGGDTVPQGVLENLQQLAQAAQGAGRGSVWDVAAQAGAARGVQWRNGMTGNAEVPMSSWERTGIPGMHSMSIQEGGLYGISPEAMGEVGYHAGSGGGMGGSRDIWVPGTPPAGTSPMSAAGYNWRSGSPL